MSDEITIFTDGGSRGNPGEAASAYVIFRNGKRITGTGKRIGVTTNNVAEYQAVIFTMQWLLENKNQLNCDEIKLNLDSLLVVNQLKGLFKVKNQNLLNYVMTVKELEKQISIKISYHFVPREKNKDADLLVNRAINNDF